MRAHLNPAVRRDPAFRGLLSDDEYRDVRAYFAAHPELSPAPLLSLPSLAARFGIGAVDVKDETHRFGLNAFKIVGVRYAVHRLGRPAAARGLVCATAGNHGRAVARAARLQGVPCTVFLPAARTADPVEHRTRAARIAAMRDDGAEVIEVAASYEEAVRRAAELGDSTGATVVSDTSWPGYEEIPRWIMAGYTQVFEEAAAQWLAPPHVVLVQAGVGGLACAAASWFAWRFGPERPFIVACEPDEAACLLESSQAGRAVTVQSSLETIMAGLRCAEPSPLAWPSLSSGIDAFLTVDDGDVRDMLGTLAALPADERLDAGPSGACGLTALGALLHDDTLAAVRDAARMDRSTRALAVVTEGA